jgi:hypothetical protein
MVDRANSLQIGRCMMALPDTPPAQATATGRWEGEGGSLAAHGSDALPDGVTATAMTQYRVGPYSYTNLDDALAEHRRQTRK